MRHALLWDTAIGFVGFFALLATVQAVINVFQPAPAWWPGLFAGLLILATYLLVRAKRRHLSHPSQQHFSPKETE